jgi:hypothetical protein
MIAPDPPSSPRISVGSTIQGAGGRPGTVIAITGSWAEIAWTDGPLGASPETTTEWLPDLLPAEGPSQ